MNRPIARTSWSVALLAGTILLLATGCGSSSDTNTAITDPSSAAGMPEPGTAGGSSSTDLAALAECFEVNAEHIGIEFLQGEDPEITHGEDFGAAAPDEIVREAVAAGGWLSADGDSYGRIRYMDAFEFATEGAATAAIPKIENGRDPYDGSRYGDRYQAVQDGTVVFVLDMPYDLTTRVDHANGVDALLDTCLPRASSVRFASPAGTMSYRIEVPQ